MTDSHDDPQAVTNESVKPSAAEAVPDPTMAPMDSAAGGPTADKEQEDESSAEEAAAQLGDFA